MALVQPLRPTRDKSLELEGHNAVPAPSPGPTVKIQYYYYYDSTSTTDSRNTSNVILILVIVSLFMDLIGLLLVLGNPGTVCTAVPAYSLPTTSSSRKEVPLARIVGITTVERDF
eukprot:2556613-Rhodomonas_salina.2